MPLLSQHAVHHMDSSSDSESELDLSNSRGSTTTTSTKEEEEMKIELAKRETVIVTRLRYLVFFILLLAAITVSLIVYHLTSSAEEQEADDQYEGAAGKVMDDFVDGVKAKLGGAASLAVAAIAHGLDNRQRWPFVTLVSDRGLEVLVWVYRNHDDSKHGQLTSSSSHPFCKLPFCLLANCIVVELPTACHFGSISFWCNTDPFQPNRSRDRQDFVGDVRQ